MDKNIGEMLDGRYEIQKRIGVGGMADVYRAYDVEEGREVAVKILKNEFINNEEFLQRFKNESKAVSMLSHPNIVKVLDVGFNEDVRFIVMEYIDGITLKDYIDTEKCLNWKEAAHLVIQILRALQHAHDRGIIHRDIKPQNIMMFSDGTIKVMDFGIAKFTYEMGITATAQTIGSVHYISPEQACGKTTDGKSDIYSVGILMYEMLTGEKPFDTDNPLTVALMQMNDTPKAPRSINPSIPQGIEEIVLKAIEKDPEDRYQSANDMIRDIEHFKSTPDMTFGYHYGGAEQEAEPEYTEPEDPEPEIEEPVEEYDPDATTVPNYVINKRRHEYAADIPDNYGTASNGILVKLATVGTVIVLILIVAGLTGLIGKALRKTDDKNFAMPKLVQYNYDDMVKRYSGKLDIKIEGKPKYSQYVENTIIYQSIEEGEQVSKGTEVFVHVSNGKNVSVVPDVVGKTEDEAINMIGVDGAGFAGTDVITVFSDTVPYNHVIRVSPVAGTEMEITKTVTIYVSKGAETDSKILPNVVGKHVDEAVKMIEEAGFTVQTDNKDDNAPAGTVVMQNFPGDTLVNPSEKIIIYVSTGIPPVATVPITITFPENAYGIFNFKVIMEGDQICAERENVNADEVTQLNFEVTGSGKKHVHIEMLNTQTKEKSLVGEYTFDFDEKKYEVKNENIPAAFEAAGGIKPSETTTELTTTTTVTTTAAHVSTAPPVPPATEPPAPPVTQPPVPPVTEPPVSVTEPPAPPMSDTTTISSDDPSPFEESGS